MSKPEIHAAIRAAVKGLHTAGWLHHKGHETGYLEAAWEHAETEAIKEITRHLQPFIEKYERLEVEYDNLLKLANGVKQDEEQMREQLEKERGVRKGLVSALTHSDHDSYVVGPCIRKLCIQCDALKAAEALDEKEGG